jgi:hypothetical protein
VLSLSAAFRNADGAAQCDRTTMSTPGSTRQASWTASASECQCAQRVVQAKPFLAAGTCTATDLATSGSSWGAVRTAWGCSCLLRASATWESGQETNSTATASTNSKVAPLMR